MNQVPVTDEGKPGRIVIGQIHGPKDELCRLYYDHQTLYFLSDRSGPNLGEMQYELKSATGAIPQILLNQEFSYSIQATSSALTVTATFRGVVYSATEPISSFWPGVPLFFKAGAYDHVGTAEAGASSIGTGQGQVSFYKIVRPTHP